MMKFQKIFIILSILIFSIVAIVWARGHMNGSHMQSMRMNHYWSVPKKESRKTNPIQANIKSIEKGKKLFQQYCLVCHGAKGKGDGLAGKNLTPPPTNLTAIMNSNDGVLAWKIANGRGAMPAWKGTLSETNIWHLTNFIKNLNKNTQ
jgi:mono/diheme cytochrome c family protein